MIKVTSDHSNLTRGRIAAAHTLHLYMQEASKCTPI